MTREAIRLWTRRMLMRYFMAGCNFFKWVFKTIKEDTKLIAATDGVPEIRNFLSILQRQKIFLMGLTNEKPDTVDISLDKVGLVILVSHGLYVFNVRREVFE